MKKQLGIFILIFFFFPRTVSADSRFVTKYDLSYKVEETGITTVTQNFTLINKTSEFLPQEYIVKIGNHEIANVIAYDQIGPLPVTLSGTGADRAIHIQFHALSAGYGQTLTWTLAYQTSQIARKNGQNWEIFIARPPDFADTDDYSIGLYVPPSFGKPYLLRPKPTTAENIWTKTDLSTYGILASYFVGQVENPYQIYDFALRYHLKNSKLYPVESEIALPPDTDFQRIYLKTLIPQPVNVRIDSDGNWLAKFDLGPAASLDVVATGSATVFLRPEFKTSTPPQNSDLFWQRYWETTDPRVEKIAKNYPTANQIYQQVLKNLNYDYNRAQNNISRLGASGVLNNPNSAISLEFTDLFIAISRAAGIAAREIDGFAFSQNKDSLHSWPEYFDPAVAGWRMVDPTWDKTTGGIDYFNFLDTNHLAFAIRGQSSTSPSPAGAYKVAPHNGDLDLEAKPSLSLRTNLSPNLTSGIPFAGKVYIDNNGPVAADLGQLIITADKLEIGNSVQKTPAIPPFGHLELDFTVQPISWNKEGSDIITVHFAGFAKDYPVNFSPIYTNKYIFVIGGLTLLGILSIFAQIARGLLFQKR